MRIYVAGPMTPTRFDQVQDASHTYNHFHEAAQGLKLAGHFVYNPADNEIPVQREPGGPVVYEQDPCYVPKTSEEWAALDGEQYTAAYREVMTRDVRWICVCDAIALLPGWRRSQGAMFEHSLGCMLGLKISNVHEFEMTPA